MIGRVSIAIWWGPGRDMSGDNLGLSLTGRHPDQAARPHGGRL
jgi:hypothetical protein